MIVVFPNGNETQNMTNADADNPAPNGPLPAMPAQPGQPAQQRQPGPQQTTSMKFPDSLAGDIVPFIDKHYRTNADRDHRAIIGLSRGLNLEVVAEGAEVLEHVQFLQDNGCDIIQGFFFSKPLEAKDFETKLYKPEPVTA